MFVNESQEILVLDAKQAPAASAGFQPETKPAGSSSRRKTERSHLNQNRAMWQLWLARTGPLSRVCDRAVEILSVVMECLLLPAPSAGHPN